MKAIRLSPEAYAEHQARVRGTRVAIAAAEVAAPLPSKYGNEKTDGYDSKREAARGAELEVLERAGQISGLRRQVRYELIPRQCSPAGRVLERACTYKADFVYVNDEGETVVEDVKGYANDTYPIKRKLMLHVHGVRVRET